MRTHASRRTSQRRPERAAADRPSARARSSREGTEDTIQDIVAKSPHVVAQRQRLDSAFGPVLQRYVAINPANYTLAAGSSFASQDVDIAGGAAAFTHKTISQTAGGAVSSTKRGTGAGAWSLPTAPVAAALPTLKYGTDGTDAIAIESTTAEPKVFYATPGVLAASNAQLAAVGAEARIVDAGGSLDGPINPALPAAGTLNMHMMKPGKTPAGLPPVVLHKFGQQSECNSFIKNIIGVSHERVAVFGGGAGHEALVAEEKEPTQEIATFAAGTGTAAGLATHLKSTGTFHGDHDQPLPASYTTMGTKAARDQALGINAGAQADVGEGYVITQGSPMPGNATLRSWLDALDNKLAGLALTTAEQDMLKHKWGYHYAGVVAKVGNDHITLENYNRGTQLDWVFDDLYAERIANLAALRRELELMAGRGAQIPSIPKLRKQWFRDLQTDLTKLGAAATADQVASRNALDAVANAARGLQVGAADLWHFKMYGNQVGESFHEQWAGALDDPMTLRVRQSTDTVRTSHTRIRAGVVPIEGETHSTATAVVLARIQAFRLPDIDGATTPKAVSDAFDEAKKDVWRAWGTAMHDWAVEAAVLMGKKPSAVPARETDPNAILGYRDQLTTLIQGWETKGWAVRSASKLALAARRADLADRRRRINLVTDITFL